ncbi:MmgE/PrpD family protein [Bordetella genomosp. 9]|nr:MmgE/PrpD family protein [Bordetella genomosp. 9]
MDPYARRLARFVLHMDASSLPDDVVDKLEALLLYALSVAMADHGEGDVLQAAMPVVHNAPGPAGLVNSSQTRSAADAAAINAALMFARNQVDTHEDICGHIGCVVIPAVLALAQARAASADTVVAALAAAYEVPPRLGHGAIASAIKRGLRGTSVFGVFGAAASAARVIGLDERKTAIALALAANYASGVTQCFIDGTPEAPLHNAHASRAGVVAALLAEQGVQAAPNSIEGRAGFFRAVSDTVPELDFSGWSIRQVTVKPVPGCVINQQPVRVATKLMAREGLSSEDVIGVTVALHPGDAAYPGIDRYGPFPTRQGACMSTAFMIEAVVQRGRLTFSDFFTLHGPGPIHEQSRRVQAVADPGITEHFACRVEMQLRDGRKVQAEALDASGMNLDHAEIIQLCEALSGEWPCHSPATAFAGLHHAVRALIRYRDADCVDAVDAVMRATRLLDT